MAEEYLTDDEQLEAVKRWLGENLVWLIAGVAIGAGLLFGWRYYDNHRNERALRAATQFGDMTVALDAKDSNKARAIAGALIKEYADSPYADQAQLLLARLAVEDGQAANAVVPLTQVVDGSKDAELRRIARLRLARVQIDLGKADDALKTLSDPTGPFAARYHEVRGDAFAAKKDEKSAIAEYQAALIAPATAGIPTGVDSALLELKIADLSPPPRTQPAPAAAASPAATPASPAATTATSKAKP